MQPYQQCVIEERDELHARLEHLHTFVHSEAFPCVHPSECDRLLRQVTHMRDYLRVLEERIAAFQS